MRKKHFKPFAVAILIIATSILNNSFYSLALANVSDTTDELRREISSATGDISKTYDHTQLFPSIGNGWEVGNELNTFTFNVNEPSIFPGNVDELFR
jgi:hypothetical protein